MKPYQTRQDGIEPLLKRISEDDTVISTPVMDVIDDTTFAYKDFKYDSINIGTFTWSLQFVWIGIPPRVKQTLTSETDPIRFGGGVSMVIWAASLL